MCLTNMEEPEIKVKENYGGHSRRTFAMEAEISQIF
jgi:hypothetical protein